ncbi:TetR family transcriptional regulator [Mycobacterium sp. 1245111.1]|uniref:TetR/AcrR family transcriptional regulator n=1 Tax=Mycobacterium sp. 1245111.1 TaxID=1834073 RepID=UPI000800BCFE|nr:TetR/AcrR family transcriptional regulator [Mycobacterium sp. 1245111.1]OBK35372.1 TetR family transcriptional regulator [Mycobacterium sp. 1245111.1]
MPRNKRPQPPAEKRAEIVSAARELFIDAGYDATSMGRLASAAGVSANTIYWYFADKDDVLLAVLNYVMAEAWTRYESVAAEPLSVRLLWLVHELQQMSRLVSTVHARAERSPAITQWHNNFHFFTASLVRVELENAGIVPAAQLDAEVMIGTFAVEGLLMHNLDEDQQRAICDTLAARWIPAPPR